MPVRGRTQENAERLADELRAGSLAEVRSFRSLDGYRPSYMEVDGRRVDPDPALHRERRSPGILVRRPGGEIALYLTTTAEQARALLGEARRLAEQVRP